MRRWDQLHCECLLCASYCAVCFTHVISFHPHMRTAEKQTDGALGSTDTKARSGPGMGPQSHSSPVLPSLQILEVPSLEGAMEIFHGDGILTKVLGSIPHWTPQGGYGHWADSLAESAKAYSDPHTLLPFPSVLLSREPSYQRSHCYHIPGTYGPSKAQFYILRGQKVAKHQIST